MTTINPALNGAVPSTKDTSNSTSSKKMSAMLDEMTGSDTVAKATGKAAQNSYFLDLSPQAQAFLEQKNSRATGGDGTFILSDKQKQQISDVIAKYKDEPFTKETYEKIETELEALGLSPDILAIRDKARNVNTTMMLLDALNGANPDGLNSSLTGVKPDQTTSDQKKENYIKSLLTEWGDISTTIDAEESDA